MTNLADLTPHTNQRGTRELPDLNPCLLWIRKSVELGCEYLVLVTLYTLQTLLVLALQTPYNLGDRVWQQ